MNMKLIIFLLAIASALPAFAAKETRLCGILAGGGRGYTLQLDKDGSFVSIDGDSKAISKLNMISGMAPLCVTGVIRPYIATRADEDPIRGQYDGDIEKEIIVIGANKIERQ